MLLLPCELSFVADLCSAAGLKSSNEIGKDEHFIT